MQMDRTKFIGGSDAAAVLGLSRWSTPLRVWAEKTGQIPMEDISGKLPVKLGVKLEGTVADLFMEETGKRVNRVNETIYHPKYPFLAANIDRRIVGEKSILEAKTTSAWKAKEWEGEEIPREYIIQALHYLAVTGADRCYVAVLIGNQDFKIKTIDRDEQILSDIVKREVEFWNDYVLSGAMPKIITSHDGDTLLKMFPLAHHGETIELTDDANQIIETLESLKSDCRNVEGLIEQKENELKVLLKDAECGVTSEHKIYWSNRIQSRIDAAQIKKVLPDVAEQFMKQVNMRVFRYV